MDITLLIMAAGIGSRFVGGIKQLEPVDDKDILSWIIQFMMLSRPDLIKLSLLFAEILGGRVAVSSDRIAAVCADNGDRGL